MDLLLSNLPAWIMEQITTIVPNPGDSFLIFTAEDELETYILNTQEVTSIHKYTDDEGEDYIEVAFKNPRPIEDYSDPRMYSPELTVLVLGELAVINIPGSEPEKHTQQES